MKIRSHGYDVIHCALFYCFMNWLNHLLRSSIQQNHPTPQRARQALMKTFALRQIQIVCSAHVYIPQQEFCMHLNKGTLYKKHFRTQLVLLQAQWNK